MQFSHPWILVSALAWTAPLAAQVDDEAPPSNAFQVYDSPAVQDRVVSVLEHVEGERWSEALVDLQILLEDYRGQVLGAHRPGLPSGRGTSRYPVYQGASEWALRTLFELPSEARELYQSRHGMKAERALTAALAGGDTAALARLARRYPLTDQALAAWWAIGDLELERGESELGLAAWGHGLSILLGRDLDPTRVPDWNDAAEALSERPELQTRIALAQSLLGGDSELAHLSTKGENATSMQPGLESVDLGRLAQTPDRWPHRFDLPRGDEWNPFATPRGDNCLYPVRDGNTLFVSTTRALFAIGAYTGELEWRTHERFLGWNRINPFEIDPLSEAISYHSSLVQPAAKSGVVVAPMQVPFAFERQDNYGELEIIRVIPERRLFAFDAATGRELWNTRPPEDWDGETGSFPERTSVVGPPVIEGTRVIVPLARMRGRIELFVGCFELHSGELLWHTPVITGQRPLNMFGRLVSEYVAPPVVVSGDRVVIQTQLGTVACVDLFTGECVWQSLYDQIVFTAGDYHSHGSLASRWRNAPPALTGNTLIAAPVDGSELIGIHMETGAVLWSKPYHELSAMVSSGYRSGPDVLLGADSRRVYLGGRRVVAFEAPGGLDREAPRRRDWAYPPENQSPLASSAPRAVLGERRIYVPDQGALFVLDRHTGRLYDEMEWSTREEGNLLVSEGTLFALSGFGLSGFFEWESMLRRANSQLAEAPDDPRRIHSVALLLHKRGVSSTGSGDFRRARQYLERSRETLEPHFERTPALATEMHAVLRSEARNLRLGADPTEAMARLDRALTLAPSRDHRRDTLLEQMAILRERDLEKWLAVATLMVNEFGEEPIEVLGARRNDDNLGWHGPLYAASASLAPTAPGFEAKYLPIDLWIRVERAIGRADRALPQDRQAALEDMHYVLHEHPSMPLHGGVSAGDWARSKIAMAVDRWGTAIYAPFEARAAELLAEARDAKDFDALSRIPELYPVAEAAIAANDVRIEVAAEAGRTAEVAQILIGELASDWQPDEATEREVRHMMLLASLIGKKGNHEMRMGVADRLATSPHASLVCSIDGEDRTVTQWRDHWATGYVEPIRPDPTFESALKRQNVPGQTGDYDLLGAAPPAPGQTGAITLVAGSSLLHAFRDGESGPWWSFDPRKGPRRDDALPSNTKAAVATSPGRVHISTLRRVVTLDRETGKEIWSQTKSGRTLLAVDHSNGVVVTRELLGPVGDANAYRLVAYDAATGVWLWNLEFLDDHFDEQCILGEGYLVLLPPQAGVAHVYDLYTASLQSSFELDYCVARTRKAAWIEHGRIILPHFMRSPRPELNHIPAFDLKSGELAWKVPLGGRNVGERNLAEVLSFEGRHFLTLLSPVIGEDTEIFELDTKLGALATRPVVSVPEAAESVGVRSYGRTVLTSPYLFVLVGPQGEDSGSHVRAVHLRYGERWRVKLPGEYRKTPGSDLPEPVVSETSIALAFPMPSLKEGSRRKRARIMMLDRSAGRVLEEVDFEEVGTGSLDLIGFGSSILISRYRQLDLLR